MWIKFTEIWIEHWHSLEGIIFPCNYAHCSFQLAYLLETSYTNTNEGDDILNLIVWWVCLNHQKMNISPLPENLIWPINEIRWSCPNFKMNFQPSLVNVVSSRIQPTTICIQFLLMNRSWQILFSVPDDFIYIKNRTGIGGKLDTRTNLVYIRYSILISIVKGKVYQKLQKWFRKCKGAVTYWRCWKKHFVGYSDEVVQRLICRMFAMFNLKMCNSKFLQWNGYSKVERTVKSAHFRLKFVIYLCLLI